MLVSVQAEGEIHRVHRLSRDGAAICVRLPLGRPCCSVGLARVAMGGVPMVALGFGSLGMFGTVGCPPETEREAGY